MNDGHQTSAVPRPRGGAAGVRTATDERRAAAARRSAHGDPPRRRAVRQSWSDPVDEHDRPDRDRDRTRSDHSRFGARILDDDLQIASRRPQRLLIAGVAAAVFAALVAALFVLPVQAWLRQEDEIAAKRQELEVLSEANRRLGTEVDHLATAEGAKEAARDELGVVGPDEERISILPDQAGALPLPAGWPYDTFAMIVSVRADVTSPATSTP